MIVYCDADDCKWNEDGKCYALAADELIADGRRRDDCPLVDLSPLTEEEEW